MGLTRLAVYRPILVVTALVATVLGGVLAYFSLGVDLLPEINTPTVTVQIAYPGAGPADVEQQVTRLVEDAVASLSDIVELRSTSDAGISTVTVEFKESVNVDLAVLDVQRVVSNLQGELPLEVEAPIYEKVDLNDQPILYLALTTTGGRDATELYQFADEQLQPRIEGLPGISAARLLGGRKPEVQVEVDPSKLRAYRLSIDDVTQAIAAQYKSVAGGTVRGGGMGAWREYGLRVEGRSADLAALRSLYVANREGVSVQLGQVARVREVAAEQSSIVRLNGRDAVALLVTKQSDANITQAVDRVLEELKAINAELPADLQLAVVTDRSDQVRTSLHDVQIELMLASILTGLVLWLFLHTVRATIIVLLAIPTCLIVTFIAMYLTGLTLNILTLLGLVTSIGILVDDSIVVIENTFRKLEHGMESVEAAIEGRSEIGMAAIAITTVDVVVYGPIIFLHGTVGGFLRNFAIVMTAATLTSLLVSFTVTPLLASRWLHSAEERSLLARIAAFWEPGYRGLEWLYRGVLRWSLRHRLVTLLASLALLAGSLAMVPLLGTEFVPDIDSRSFYMAGEMPGGTALENTDQAARRWEQQLLDHERFPEVEKVYIVVGAGATDLDRGPRFLSVNVEIVPRHERSRTSQQIQRAMLEVSREIPGLQTNVSGSRAGGSGQAVQVRLFGTDIAELERWTAEAQRRLEAEPRLTDVTNSAAIRSPEIVAWVDQERLRDLGLTTQQVGSAVRTSYQGVLLRGRYPWPDGTQVDIRVRLPEQLRLDTERVQDLPLVTNDGALVSLGQVARFEQRGVPSRIQRINRQRVATIGADPLGVPLGTATSLVNGELQALPWPTGVRWELGGQSSDQQESFGQLFMALAVSVVLVYLVLTVLYESVVFPIVTLAALPLALIGALGGLLLFHNTLNILSMIGVVALFGLVGKNGILLIDYTNHLRQHGVPREEALLQAGPARLRPILMTSTALILGLMPVALKLGEGGELRAPLASVLIGGMTTSTLLTLLFVPVSYTYFDGFQAWLVGLFGRRPAKVVAPSAAANGRAKSEVAGVDGRRSPGRPAEMEQQLIRRVLQTADSKGTEILSEEGVLDVLPHLAPEEKALLQPYAAAEAMEFLQAELDKVEAKTREREAYLRERYPAATGRPKGETQLTDVYELEKKVIRELSDASREKLFVDVLRHRLERARQRVADLQEDARWTVKSSASSQRRRFEAWTEQEVLNDLARQWLVWLRGKQPPIASKGGE